MYMPLYVILWDFYLLSFRIEIKIKIEFSRIFIIICFGVILFYFSYTFFLLFCQKKYKILFLLCWTSYANSTCCSVRFYCMILSTCRICFCEKTWRQFLFFYIIHRFLCKFWRFMNIVKHFGKFVPICHKSVIC